jgi:hypothetical protein
MKTLVVYVFNIYNERVQYFIQNAIFEDKDVDFLIVANGVNISLQLPDYVKVLNRQNIGFDFGGWSDGISINNNYQNYDYFIFANASIIGPFLPRYYKGKWTDIFIEGLTDDIKLFGSTINTCGRQELAHVQSYIFSMDKQTLEYLRIKNIFSTQHYPKNMYEAVWHKEVPMSRIVLENGWNIGCLMNHYKNVDFRKQINVELLDDIACPTYFTESLFRNFYEVVFIKGNRFPNLSILR